MTLENTFYFLGIIFILLSFAFLIAAGVLVWLAIKKVKELENEVRYKLSEQHLKEISSSTLKASYPLLLSAGIGLVYKAISKKVFKN